MKFSMFIQPPRPTPWRVTTCSGLVLNLVPVDLQESLMIGHKWIL